MLAILQLINKAKLYIIALVVFTLAGIYITFPLIFHLGSVTTGYGDELLIAWIHNWNINSILSGNILNIFDANLYYPYKLSLAYSDSHFITSILSIIPVIINEPISAHNFTLIFSLIFLGFSIYALSYYLTKDFLASILAGMLVIFSPSIFGYFVHLQMLSIGWVPLSILFFLIFIKSRKSRYLGVSLLFFTLQMYNSFLPGYFIIFSYLVILGFQWKDNSRNVKVLVNKKNVLILLVSIILIFPIITPYYQVSKEFAYIRDIRGSIHNSLQPEDFVYPGPTTRLRNVLLTIFPVNKTPGKAQLHEGYIGFIFTILIFLSIWYLIKNYKKKNLHLHMFFSIAVIGFVLSFGPALHLNRQTIHEPFPIILPYALFYYVAPGFQGFRTPLRWEMLFIIAMAIVIAVILQKLFKKYLFRKKLLIYSLFFVGIIAEFNPALNFVPIVKLKDFPQVYSWLSSTPKETKIIEMPIYNWKMYPYSPTEQMRDYYTISHFRKTINGASGFSPPPWQNLVTNLLSDFPNDRSLETLKNLDVNYIIVHKNEYDILYKDKYSINGKKIANGQKIIDELQKKDSIKLRKRFGEDFVFEIL